MKLTSGLNEVRGIAEHLGNFYKKFSFKPCYILRVKRGRGIAAGGSHEVRNPEEL